jgi:predicted O-methyltransferase YrrM
MSDMNPTPALEVVLSELEEFGSENDAVMTERGKRMLNITRETGEFLAVLVRSTRARRVLEIGTSNGYSTLWLAWALETAGTATKLTTLEKSEYKRGLAAENFRRTGMTGRIAQVAGDAGEFLRAAETEAFDFIFLDSERSEYVGWWPEIQRVLAPGGLLVVDNATSHPGEMAGLVAAVKAEGRFTTCTVPVGNGGFMAVKGTGSSMHPHPSSKRADQGVLAK